MLDKIHLQKIGIKGTEDENDFLVNYGIFSTLC